MARGAVIQLKVHVSDEGSSCSLTPGSLLRPHRFISLIELDPGEEGLEVSPDLSSLFSNNFQFCYQIPSCFGKRQLVIC
jgi:hypothetical protein